MKVETAQGHLMFKIGASNISCNCIGEPYSTQIVEQFEQLQKANEHNEQAIRFCNQKISQLELEAKDYREQIGFWKAKAGPCV